jgi:hypothetical protein
MTPIFDSFKKLGHYISPGFDKLGKIRGPAGAVHGTFTGFFGRLAQPLIS